MSLARTAVRGVRATLLGQWGRLIIQIGSTMILARLLTPEDYGLVGMVLAVTGFAERLKTMGLSTVTIQRRTVSQDELSFLFWTNVALSLVVAIIVGALSPLIAAFYGSPELTGITLALTLSFVFGGVGAQHVALLSRRMEFGSLATVEVAAIFSGAVTAIAAAWLGAGYWSLVLFQLVQPAVRAVMAWQRTRWRPNRPGSVDGGRALLAFGANLSGFELLNYFSRHMDNILIGRYLGSEALGTYAKAYNLLLLPISQIQSPVHRVAIPTLSRLQDEPERFRRFFLTGLRSVAFVVMPLVTLLAVLAEEVVLIVLGDQWTGAIRVFQILAVVGLAQALVHSNGWLYVALGNARRQFLWSLFSAPIVVTSFVVGLPGGIEGVATAYAVAIWFLFLPSLWNATRGTPVSIRDALGCGVRPAIVSAAGAIAVVALRSLLPPMHPVLSAGILGLCFVGAVVLTVAGFPAAREDVRSMISLMRGGLTGPK